MKDQLQGKQPEGLRHTEIRQVPGVGVHRSLRDDVKDEAMVLLRVIERLPLLSEAPCDDAEGLRRQLASIHRNHITLARFATQLLSPG